MQVITAIKKITNRVNCQRSEKRSKTHKRLKEQFLIRRNRNKNFVLFPFVLFHLIKKRYFNLLCVFGALVSLDCNNLVDLED